MMIHTRKLTSEEIDQLKIDLKDIDHEFLSWVGSLNAMDYWHNYGLESFHTIILDDLVSSFAVMKLLQYT